MEPGPTTDKRPATRAEARALSHPLRLRILRLCLDEALTNRQLAERLGEQPATVLYHVRTLAREGFLVREPERRGQRAAREFPYRSTRKSLTLQLGLDSRGHLAILDAARAEIAESGPESVLTISRLGIRLPAERLRELIDAVDGVIERAKAADDPRGEPVGLLVMLHRRG
jgi:DNA-binding transcriptional ArsR family regulator